MSAEDDDGGAREGGGVTAAGAGGDAFDYGVGPLPLAHLELLLLEFWVDGGVPEEEAETLEWLDWDCLEPEEYCYYSSWLEAYSGYSY